MCRFYTSKVEVWITRYTCNTTTFKLVAQQQQPSSLVCLSHRVLHFFEILKGRNGDCPSCMSRQVRVYVAVPRLSVITNSATLRLLTAPSVGASFQRSSQLGLCTAFVHLALHRLRIRCQLTFISCQKSHKPPTGAS